MTKLPHPRLQQLLALLHAEPLPQEELARRLNVSTRTVRTDVATLNELIATRGAHLIHQRAAVTSSRSTIRDCSMRCWPPRGRRALCLAPAASGCCTSRSCC